MDRDNFNCRDFGLSLCSVGVSVIVSTIAPATDGLGYPFLKQWTAP